MDPVTLHVSIDRPREEVFAYLSDVANYPEFMDHFLKNWRLTRVESYGRGAGARYRVLGPLNRFSWEDMTFLQVQPPHRIVTVGRGGKFNRIQTNGEWRLEPAGATGTRVEYTYETVPALITDKIVDAFRGSWWFRHEAKKGMKRLRAILEEGRDRGQRATVAGL